MEMGENNRRRMWGRSYNEKEGRERPGSDYTRPSEPRKTHKQVIYFNILDTNQFLGAISLHGQEYEEKHHKHNDKTYKESNPKIATKIMPEIGNEDRLKRKWNIQP